MPNIGQNWKVSGLCDLEIWQMALNKATLRDLIAVTGLIILLKLDSNRRLISLCDLEIWWMTSKNNKASLIFYIELCASFQTHQWIQTGVTVRKCSIRVKIGDFFVPHTLEQGKSEGIESCDRPIVRKRPIWVKIGDVLSRVTLKFDGWPWKTIGHLSFAVLSFVQIT